MSEAPVMISIGNFLVEALVDQGNGLDVAVICHPHPLYGGRMDNNVVSTLQKSLRDWGWGTLRFNFRGVGGSSGHHRGAQQDAEDLLTVCQYVQEQGKRSLHLAGYSYGAWIGLRTIKLGLDPDTAILVSPPLDFLDFRGLAPPLCPCLITVGDQDDFCAVGSLKKWIAGILDSQQPTLVEILPHCDHFYWGQEGLLGARVGAFLTKQEEA
jgi:uncharacterized protein